MKLIAAGGDHSLAGIFSPLVQYPVDVSKDLLLIYNTNSADSATVINYYLAQRPMVSNANVLGVSVTNSTNYEAIAPVDFTNGIWTPLTNWLAANPTKRPAYVILFLDVPSRLADCATNPADFPFYCGTAGNYGSVSYEIATRIAGWQPFVTHINMNGTNDCIGYIDKLAAIGSSYSPGHLIISASAGGYGNTNYLLDDIRYGGILGWQNYSQWGAMVSSATNALLASGVSPSAILFYDGLDIVSNGVAYSLTHPTGTTNVAGYAAGAPIVRWGLTMPRMAM